MAKQTEMAAFFEAFDHYGNWFGTATRAAIKKSGLQVGDLVGYEKLAVATDGWAYRVKR